MIYNIVTEMEKLGLQEQNMVAMLYSQLINSFESETERFTHKNLVDRINLAHSIFNRIKL